MSKYTQQRTPEKTGSFFYRNLPVVVFILGVKILDAYLLWPIAIGIAVILSYGLLGYWIPEKPKQRFLKHFGLAVLFSIAVSAIAYLIVLLGWIEEK